jgi:hypothetical protein
MGDHGPPERGLAGARLVGTTDARADDNGAQGTRGTMPVQTMTRGTAVQRMNPAPGKPRRLALEPAMLGQPVR